MRKSLGPLRGGVVWALAITEAPHGLAVLSVPGLGVSQAAGYSIRSPPYPTSMSSPTYMLSAHRPKPPVDVDKEADMGPGSYQKPLHFPAYVVHKTGRDLLQDSWCNKGTAFPIVERDRLGLRGLLPPRPLDIDKQMDRFLSDYYATSEKLISDEEAKAGGVTSEMARRWQLLQQLHNRNETLFYKVLMEKFVEMAPIIYTPTVGWVCSNYHRLYRTPRGMYFSAEDRGQMAAMAYNWPQHDVNAIVVTDGSRILGLGDLGVNGLGIPVGKLDLYCAAAGFHPSKVLPVVIDVGTNNEALRADPLYPGLQRPRIKGIEYFEIVDEVVTALMSRWPQAVLQFEDFSTQYASKLLARYRHHHLVFNDDIQGTAATALAGLYGALRVIGAPASAIAHQRIVCVGAGSAGMGVASMVAKAMVKHGATAKQACANFWVIDDVGLVTKARRMPLTAAVAPFARTGVAEEKFEGQPLLDVIKRVKPTILLGLAGAGRLFTREVLEAMNEACGQQRPVIFPMSNPTSKMECTAEEALRYTGGRCVFASGSPQPPVDLSDMGGSSATQVAQANNMYIFPGIALGAYLGQTSTVSDDMLMTAAEALPHQISRSDLARGLVYPRLNNIRDISVIIAMEVIKCAAQDGQLGNPMMRDALAEGDEELASLIRRSMFMPQYTSMAYLPPGIGE